MLPVLAALALGQEPPDAQTSGTASAAANPPSMFEEIRFEEKLVVEGKVEKPQVQFPLLKEPPPEKPIAFQASFMREILELERENTFRGNQGGGRQ